MLGGLYGRMKSHVTPGNVMRSAAVSFGLPAGVGFAASGAEPAGAWAGLKGGLMGGVAGGIKGGLFFGTLGVMGGMGLASTAGRRALTAFANKYGAGIGARIAPGLVRAGLVQNAGLVPKASRIFLQELASTQTPALNLVTAAGALGVGGGYIAGSAVGAVTGAWGAGKNVRASIAYNQFGGIGL